MFSSRSFILAIGVLFLSGCSAKLNLGNNADSAASCGAVEGYPYFGKETCFERVSGRALVEGDIIVQPVSDLPQKRTAVARTGLYYRWSNGVVPYVISPEINHPEWIFAAIEEFHAKTPVRFRPKTDVDTDYVVFVEAALDANYCGLSQVGRQGGRQDIMVNSALGCSTGTLIHEMGHAIGLWHEQSREDRDKYVKIDFDNIQPEMAFNFNKQVLDGEDIGSYDYESIMHYNQYAYAIDWRKPTIIAKDKSMQKFIGQRTHLSEKDALAIYNMYGFRLDVLDREPTQVTIRFQLPLNAVASLQMGNSEKSLSDKAATFTARLLPNGFYEYRAIVDGLAENRAYFYRVAVTYANGFKYQTPTQKFDTDFSAPTIFAQSVRWDAIAEDYVAEWFTTEPTVGILSPVLQPDSVPSKPVYDDVTRHHKLHIPLANLGRGEAYQFTFLAIDGSGNFAEPATFNLTTKVLPPILSKVFHREAATSISIDWLSDIPGTTVIRYGQYSLSERMERNDSDIFHSMFITNLKPDTGYFVRVETTDPLNGLTKRGPLMYLRTTDLVRITGAQTVVASTQALSLPGLTSVEIKVQATTSHPIGAKLTVILLDKNYNVLTRLKMKQVKPLSPTFEAQLPVWDAVYVGVMSAKGGLDIKQLP